MILFLLTFFLLYGSLHLYIFFKIRGALVLGVITTALLIAFMAAMISAPVIVWISERHGFEWLARLIGYIAYTWMALAFLFFSFSLVVDLYRLLVYTTGLIIQKDLSHLASSPGIRLVILSVITAVIALYGYFEARHIRNETLIIKNPKIPEGSDPLTIVQISDVHLGLIVREERLKRILREVYRAQPDILVCTGDLVDGQMGNLTGLAELLEEINPRYGKFAITGNHEFYAGLDQALDFMKKAGFTVLRGEAVNIAGILNIAGIDDSTGRRFDSSKGIREGVLLSSLSRENFTLLLKHVPIVDKGALGLFDLQLSGHTHKGQIFPFSLITRLFFPAGSGLMRLPHDSYLYTSRGSGTWGPPIRFLSPPEVSVIKLVNEDI
jgi:predicted MPP superfamily phosphohydrolase